MTTATMARVIISRPVIGICFSQVCAMADAEDAELLAEANRQNPAGTKLGWSRVIRVPEDEAEGNKIPVRCERYPDRLHFILAC